MTFRQLNRRELITGISGAALAGSGLVKDAAAAQDRPDFDVPDGACDCHIHLYDPARFPYLENARLRPEHASVADYKQQVQQRLRTPRVIAVTPSTYGTDNRCMVDGIGQYKGEARGIAVVAATVSDDELKSLHAAGVRGVRVNMPKDQLIALSHRLHELGWNMEFLGRLPDMEETLLSLPTPVVLDHLASVPMPDGVNSPAYKTARKLLDTGNAWMKVSGAYIQSKAGPPDYPDTSAIAKDFIAAAPQRCLWATNWPYPDISAGANAVPRPDSLPFFNLFGRWVPDAKLRHQILVENPEKLYGFDPANRPRAL